MTLPTPLSPASAAPVGPAAPAEPLVALERRAPGTRRRRGDRRARLLRYRWLYLMLAPGVVYFAVFKYGPMYGVTIAFKDYVPFLGINDSPWVGLKYFQQLFAGSDFLRILTNTMILAALKIAFA